MDAAVVASKKTFIRVVEVWVPGNDRSMLEFSAGLYGSARRFGAASRRMCFGLGEGLPGQAWLEGRPIVLQRFAGANFRRTEAAHAEGLTCGIALPVFAGDFLTAVLVIFCGDDEDHAGAIELWSNDPAASKDMTLDDGYYGTTADAFEFISRRTAFREGYGLPGLAWQSRLPVFQEDLGKGERFLRADSAIKVGINRGFVLPCATRGPSTFVLAFLSAIATPIVRRFETWLPAADGACLTLAGGFCEITGTVRAGAASDSIERGQGTLGRAAFTGVPMVGESATSEPGLVGRAASAAGLAAMVAIPVLHDGRLRAVVAWYF
ncbi:GAF domain-containing protein [Accumulibacter sp.]|uniref:GAF domain-containing protein n=1 Tax=Accumulibacter sp. TaxID=2053492 RepID=UPI0025D04CCC|nr:GAF domain-containing protein [Accumulibacter sp.]MCM8610878.1 GAF domain-containing protein [Accumulibacter sp.]MCM8634698.1 GAF domain-containing protein [Accumulibacter sp.]MCM8638252.1 GAF domain-containing protein [Accumulibacter sp.]